MAINTIIRHDATGQPPAELIHLLSGGRRRNFNGSSSSPRLGAPHLGRRRSDEHMLLPAGLCGGGGGLHRNRSEGAVVTSSAFVPPPSINLLIERGGSEPPVLREPYRNPLGEVQRNNSPSSTRERYASSGGAYDRFPEELQTGVFRCPPSKNGQPIPPPIASMVKSIPQHGNQHFRQRHIDEEAEAKASEEAKHQQMLNMQSGIEASLKETRNPSETDADIDDEALACAVKASRETFDEEYRNQEVRNALEQRIVKISLAASLADPVKKSEEELVGEALKKSLADPIPKSEEQLFEEAREKSLDDIERLEVIMKSEEKLVEVAKQKSLHTLSKDEELLDDVMRQSLEDAHKDPLWRVLEESLTESLEADTRRRLTSSTHLLSYGGDDGISDCSSVEQRMPSRFDSPLKGSDLDLMDRKMPALDLPAAQDCEEDQAQNSHRSSSNSDCSCSVDFLDRKMTAQELRASRNGDVLSSSSVDLLDRKMPAVDLRASQNDAISSSSLLSNPSDYFSSAASARSVDQHSKDSRTRKARCLSVDGASLSLINGVYTEEVDESNMFTLRVGLDDRTATVASIYQTTSTQGKREWVLSLFNSNFPPETEAGMDVILYTASVDKFNEEELPSHSTNWVSRNAMVLTGSPPQVAEM